MSVFNDFLIKQACGQVFMSDHFDVVEAFHLMEKTLQVPEGITPLDCFHSQQAEDYLRDVKHYRSEIENTTRELLELVAVGLSTEPGQYDLEKMIDIVNGGKQTAK